MPKPALSSLDSALRIIVAVAEEHQITRASARLRLAQPWVSRQIKRIEEAAGVLLFKRTHTGVDITPSGEAFVQQAKEALRHGQMAFNQAQAANPDAADKLLIGISPTFDPLTGEQVCDCIRQALPGADLEIISSFVSTQIMLLARIELHLGLVELPIHTKELHVLAIKREPLLLAAGAGNPSLRKHAFLTQRLEERRCVMLSRTENPYQHRIFNQLAKQGLAPNRVREVLTLPEIFNIIERGDSFALVPQSAAKLKPDGILFRELPDFRVDYGVAFYDDHRSPNVRAAVQALAHRFAKQRAAIKKENAHRDAAISRKSH